MKHDKNSNNKMTLGWISMVSGASRLLVACLVALQSILSLSGIFYDTFFRYKESGILLFFCVLQGMRLPDRSPDITAAAVHNTDVNLYKTDFIPEKP